MDGEKPPRPNFVFILIDDLGWKDLSCYGSTFYRKPRAKASEFIGQAYRGQISPHEALSQIHRQVSEILKKKK